MHLIAVSGEQLFAALADTTRLRILRLLADTNEEVCLCELVDSLNEPQYNVSRHLKVLKQAGLLTAEREGRWVYHRLVKGVTYLRKLHAAVRALPDPAAVFEGDRARFLTRMELREKGRCRVGVQTKRLAAATG